MNIPELNERERQLANQLARYPLMFAAPIFFGIPPELGGTVEDLNNATVTLLELKGRRYGVTNSHVIDGYRERFANDNRIFCQIGLVNLNPLERIVSESQKYDLVVLDLNDNAESVLNPIGEVARAFHAPREWPPELPAVDNFVMFGGYPGSRRAAHLEGVGFGSISSGGSRVNSVQEDVFTFQIEIEKCVVSFNTDGLGFAQLPGISGSPVLARRQLGGGVDVFDMVGTFFEYYEEWDLLRARPLTLIGLDGVIRG